MRQLDIKLKVNKLNHHIYQWANCELLYKKMKYIALLLFFCIQSNLLANEIIIDIFFISNDESTKVMEFEDILTYRQFENSATWVDSLGDYGLLKCMGNYITSIDEGTILKNYCKGKNRNNDIFWLTMNRNSNDYDAGIGRTKYLQGTGKFKNFIGIECVYGIEIIEGMAALKQKCILN